MVNVAKDSEEERWRAARMARFARFRARLGYTSRPQLAKAMGGINKNTYDSWEGLGSAPTSDMLAKGLRALGIWDAPQTFWWLSTGEGREPYWLSDPTLDPRSAPAELPDGGPPRPGIAMPQAALEKGREALLELRRLRDATGLREPHVMRAHLALEAAAGHFLNEAGAQESI
jgi:hypothetical protein